MFNRKNLRLGDLLVSVGKITDEQLRYALDAQRESKMKLGEVLKDLRFITEKDIVEVLEFQLGIPRVELDKYYIDPDVPKIVSEEFAKTNVLIPIRKKDNMVTVAMNDPLNIILINDMEIMTNLTVQPMIATYDDIMAAIDQHYSKQFAEQAVEEFTKEFNLTKEEIDEELLTEINNAPVVRLVNTILIQAAQTRASDIHIEPENNYVRIRFRIDGDLSEVMRPAKETHGPILTRLKIMAKLNIAEKRVPQDGRIELSIKGKDLDLRVSTIPSIYGEKMVIRLLDRSSFLRKVNELGFSPEEEETFNDMIRSRNGIILITGPTGSGKSTTMYSILSALNTQNRHIITVEDPVEYRMTGIIQSQVNVKAGYTFAGGLRAMLRQDPDVIMLGEIRDNETAEIAIRAAITGHLVISTLHTNSSFSTVNRLLNMDIEAYLLSSSIVGVVSQVLVKKLCDHCKLPLLPDEEQRQILGLDPVYPTPVFKAMGCTQCGQSGYKGRQTVFEILKFNHETRKMIAEGVSVEQLKYYQLKNGMKTLQQRCRELVIEGHTTIEEYLKVAFSLDA